jgi:hypothetical protein
MDLSARATMRNRIEHASSIQGVTENGAIKSVR